MSTEAADILRDVLLSLRSDGWARYSGGPRLSPPASGLPFEVGSPGGTCLKGAIDRVVMRENRLRGLQLIEAEADCWPFVYRAIDGLFPERLGPADTMCDFNTHPATTFANVEQVLEKAIAMAEELV